jgi:hypothetical protein
MLPEKFNQLSHKNLGAFLYRPRNRQRCGNRLVAYKMEYRPPQNTPGIPILPSFPSVRENKNRPETQFFLNCKATGYLSNG